MGEITAITSEAGGPLNKGYHFFKVVVTTMAKIDSKIYNRMTVANKNASNCDIALLQHRAFLSIT